MTRDNLIDAGWTPDNGLWISPINGAMLSFEQARREQSMREQAENAFADDESMEVAQ